MTERPEAGLDPGGEQWAEVAVALPLRQTFTYRVPPSLYGRLIPGARVQAPFGRRRVAGFLVSVGPARGVAPAGLRDLAGLVDREPVIPAELLAVLRKAADYYLHPLGEVLEAALPPGAHAASEPHLALLAPGRAILDDAVLDRTSHDLLSALTSGPRAESWVLHRISGLGPAQVKKARARGWIDRVDVVDAPDLGPAQETVVRRLDAPKAGTPPRLGVRQRLILERLRERDAVTLEELRQVHPEARAISEGLARHGLVALETRDTPRDPLLASEVPIAPPPTLNSAQATVVARVHDALDARVYRGFLLHGVTGSGKTEVYLRAIERVLDAGGGAIVLVPEIALTPQLVGRFRARFGDALGLLHSALSDRVRLAAWRDLREGRLRLAVGTRSALFAPVADLRLIVVDEEHDPSFKQEEGFRYHARDLSLLRAREADAVAILGSATPSLESWHNVTMGKLERLCLPERATKHSLPEVTIVDLARNKRGPSGASLLSAPLHEALRETLEAREQAILFLNRRGFAPTVLCEECGETQRCQACSVGLVLHQRTAMLRCHLCDFAMDLPERCPRCDTGVLRSIGIGTEQVEAMIRDAFPTARVGRLDRDTASARGIEEVLARLGSGALDVLVGTQMVAKGHDFPGVTLVGVIFADHGLSLPDFRAAERTFQLLAQVAGRAGRGATAGRVLVQTFLPEHMAVQAAAHHDYEGFCTRELAARAELQYPPFSRLVAFRVDAGSQARGRGTSQILADAARAAARGTNVRVTGPAEAPIARVRGRWRFRLFVRGPELRVLRQVVLAVARKAEEAPAGVRVTIDVDPVAML
jgi:primosomal protein N' (replication factor Y)